MTYHYPKWAPKELCEYHEKWVKDSPDLKNESFYILEQLITNKQMESIWVKLEKLAARKKIQAPDYYFGLFMAIEPSGPYGINRLTKAELRDAVEEIEKNSRVLIRLVNKVMPFAFVNNAPRELDNLVIDVLKNIGAQARDVLNQPRTINRKGGSTNPKEDYFIRELSVFFRQTFGKPMNNIVAELHSIFMPEEEGITDGDVGNKVRYQKSIVKKIPL